MRVRGGPSEARGSHYLIVGRRHPGLDFVGTSEAGPHEDLHELRHRNCIRSANRVADRLWSVAPCGGCPLRFRDTEATGTPAANAAKARRLCDELAAKMPLRRAVH